MRTAGFVTVAIFLQRRRCDGSSFWLPAVGKEPPAFDLLYWNNDGTRMTREAHMFFLRDICLENGLTKPGKLVVKGVPIDLRNLRQDVYAVGTLQDHIVPWKGAWRTTQLVGGSAHFVL